MKNFSKKHWVWVVLEIFLFLIALFIYFDNKELGKVAFIIWGLFLVGIPLCIGLCMGDKKWKQNFLGFATGYAAPFWTGSTWFTGFFLDVTFRKKVTSRNPPCRRNNTQTISLGLMIKIGLSSHARQQRPYISPCSKGRLQQSFSTFTTGPDNGYFLPP